VVLTTSMAVADDATLSSTQRFTDEQFGVSFEVPAGWQRQDSSLEVRQKILVPSNIRLRKLGNL
jgi:hypothetical protein